MAKKTALKSKRKRPHRSDLRLIRDLFLTDLNDFICGPDDDLMADLNLYHPFVKSDKDEENHQLLSMVINNENK